MLEGQRIVLTGGFGLLGRTLTGSLEAAGALPLITTRDAKKAEAFNASANEDGRATRALHLAMSDEGEVRDFAANVVKEFGPVSGLVNNAYAVLPDRIAGDVPWSHWSEAMRVGVAAVETLSTRFVSERKPEHAMSIVNIASIYAIRAPNFGIYRDGQLPNPIYYGATKAAVLAMTRYLGAFWGEGNVRVNAVSPGGIANNQDAEFPSRYGETVPSRRMVSAEEVASAVLFLLSDRSSGMTGQNVVVDGGKTIW